MLVPRHWWSASVLLLTASFQLADQGFSERKAKATTLILCYRSNTSCDLPWGPIQSFPYQSELQKTSLSVPLLQHISHVTWKCLAWQELQLSSPTIKTSKIPTEDTEDVHGRRVWAGRDQREHTKTQRGAACCPKARCLQELLGNSAGLVALGGQDNPNMETYIYIIIHTHTVKRNSCFTTFLYITSITASYALCQ